MCHRRFLQDFIINKQTNSQTDKLNKLTLIIIQSLQVIESNNEMLSKLAFFYKLIEGLIKVWNLYLNTFSCIFMLKEIYF